MVLTVSFGLSPVIGLVCHRHLRVETQNLTQRRGVRTTRLRRPRSAPFVSATACVHRIPPRVRDDREPPLVGRDGGISELIWLGHERKYFRNWDWTAQIRLIRLKKFGSARSRPGNSAKRALSAMPGDATKLCFAPMSRPSTSNKVRTWITGTSPVMTTFSGSVLSLKSIGRHGRACPGQPRSLRTRGTKDVDHRDIGAKQSFAASPGDDDLFRFCVVVEVYSPSCRVCPGQAR